MAWQELFAAMALVLVLEGIVPFISPDALRKTYQRLIEMDDKTIRMSGLLSMIAGVILLTLVR
ncbi:MAG: hypothetical protein ACJA2Y_001522 [Cycloclasticus pugetii]|jgi:uncharacterized protein YjeT (DUF2065 family)|uniref:DUF2065 domain-containing protein n=2 Tax=Cycloclasticus TaxID=34067 RepID=S5T6V1_9GAMM|nr:MULTISPECIES: DUF2065 domain-containing protein [Cycloclasticus]AFT67584.1 putative transmembrane protein [Cycloclasticus sp. P1]AGS39244.1 hypothetical protein CYCME_0911 [Cycloclasticus zancles 78-ME]ATI02870.1 DUF2065 domain-containing protein [Cycloclasticus sp. PY97N]EPD13616.1 transmembrane protein [Cycloclasticus pugetii]MBV1898896.1 DUF2065 domain-containing protein [Cycloclasticus sp.]|tara:strand:- start:246 stop:434 length:189 start_codon:yes stop_codon:yes gene_type:complete